MVGGSLANGGTSNATVVGSGGKSSTRSSAGTAQGGTGSDGGAQATGGAHRTALGGTTAMGGTTSTLSWSTGGIGKNTGGVPETGGFRATGGDSQTRSSTTGSGVQTGGAPTTGGSIGIGGSSNWGGNSTTATGGTSTCRTWDASRFAIGADITDQEVAPDATRANLLSLMKSHGFNYVRLRTFVDPKASDGYDKTNGYADISHTAAFGKQVKDACMGLLVDFHYSDNWADPSKQCVPVAWQKHTTITALADALYAYTKDSIQKLIAAGARPDMVQIGNETTPGMLLHRCDGDGLPIGDNPVTGSTANWANLGALLKAGADAVRDVDPKILISFHIDRGGDKPTEKAGSALDMGVYWLTNAMKYVTPDAFGESCYQKYQGDPNSTTNTKKTWTSTFEGLAAKFPNVKLFAAEYGPMQREINDVVYGLANRQGIGTFNWEPTTQGDWNTGHDLLRRTGSTYVTQPDLALYDPMMAAYADRL